MNDYLLPEQRRTIGIALFVVGLCCLALAAVTVGMATSARASNAARYSQVQSQCKASLTGLGGEVEEIPGRIIWRKRGLEEGVVRLGEASVVGVLCPGWRMKTACIGSQCPESDAMRIVLEPMNTEEEE